MGLGEARSGVSFIRQEILVLSRCSQGKACWPAESPLDLGPKLWDPWGMGGWGWVGGGWQVSPQSSFTSQRKGVGPFARRRQA